MEFRDENAEGTQITCSDCGKEFLFTDGERDFYESKGYTIPKLCKPCRILKKKQIESNSGKTEKRIVG